MYCKFCKRQIKDDARFCPGCGKFVGEKSETRENEIRSEKEKEKVFEKVVRNFSWLTKKGAVIMAVCFAVAVIAGISIGVHIKNEKEKEVRAERKRLERLERKSRLWRRNMQN